jgi:hypothetical protein
MLREARKEDARRLPPKLVAGRCAPARSRCRDRVGPRRIAYPARERVLYKRPLPPPFLYGDRPCSSPALRSPRRSWRARMEFPTLRSQSLLPSELRPPQACRAAPPSPRAPPATASCAALTPQSHPTVELPPPPPREGRRPCLSSRPGRRSSSHARPLRPPLTTIVGG